MFMWGKAKLLQEEADKKKKALLEKEKSKAQAIVPHESADTKRESLTTEETKSKKSSPPKFASLQRNAGQQKLEMNHPALSPHGESARKRRASNDGIIVTHELLVENKDSDTIEERMQNAARQREERRKEDKANNSLIPENFYHDGFSTSLPSLNYIWVGPPRYEKGGHDVKGIISMARNHVHFKTPKEERNPIIFWCQGQYLEEYQEFFKQENIKVEVRSIDHCLMNDKNIFSNRVKKLYQELLSVNRNQVYDRIYMKDLLSYYLLFRQDGTRGTYVIDTNVQASLTEKVNLAAYDHYRLPSISKEPELIHGEVIDRIAECWMQFMPALSSENKRIDGMSPQEILTRCMREYLEKFETIIKPMFEDFGYDIDRGYCNGGAGDHMIASLYWYGKRKANMLKNNGWECPGIIEGAITVKECGLTKEYYNTHRGEKNSYGAPHIHARLFKPSELLFDLQFGININIVANSLTKLAGESIYKNHNLLNLAVCEYFYQMDNQEIEVSFNDLLKITDILFDKGIDVNHQYEAIKEESELRPEILKEVKTSLHEALQHKNRELVQYLLSHGADPRIPLTRTNLTTGKKEEIPTIALATTKEMQKEIEQALAKHTPTAPRI